MVFFLPFISSIWTAINPQWKWSRTTNNKALIVCFVECYECYCPHQTGCCCDLSPSIIRGSVLRPERGEGVVSAHWSVIRVLCIWNLTPSRALTERCPVHWIIHRYFLIPVAWNRKYDEQHGPDCRCQMNVECCLISLNTPLVADARPMCCLPPLLRVWLHLCWPPCAPAWPGSVGVRSPERKHVTYNIEWRRDCQPIAEY